MGKYKLIVLIKYLVSDLCDFTSFNASSKERSNVFIMYATTTIPLRDIPAKLEN